MKNKNLYIFLTLQLFLILINLFNINKTLFGIELNIILKLILVLYSFTFVMFFSKIKKITKVFIFSLLVMLFSLLFFKPNPLQNIIASFYYVATYSFIISYYQNKNIVKYNIINSLKVLLIVLELFLLLSGNSSFTLELIVNILLIVSFFYFEKEKIFSLSLFLLSILLACTNGMYLIFYNLLFIMFIILLYSILKRRNIFLSSFMILILLFISFIFKIFDIATIYNSFYLFDLNFELSNLLIVLPLFALTILILYNITKNKNVSLNIILNVYVLMLITSFALLSIENINNEFIILIYSYLLVIIINYISNINKELNDSVTILALHTGYGGIEQYISSLTKMIKKKIYIVSTYKLYDEPPFTYNADIRYLIEYGPNKKELKEAVKNKKILSVLRHLCLSIKILYLKKYKNIEEIESIDSKYIITTRQFHNELVGLYSRNDIIKIATEHNYHNENKKYIRKLINSVNNIDYFILVSKYLEKYYKDRVRAKSLYIPNVIENLPKKKNKMYNHSLISIGRLSYEKAQKDLIELVYLLKEDYKDIKLTLIGDGEEKENIEKLIKDKKLEKNVILTGFLNKEEIEKYLLESNIFVTTSKTESFGLVAIEACSYKLPVVAFDSALGIKEILSGDNGVLIKDRNILKMKEKIEELFENKEYRDKISNNGYENVKKYLMINVAKEWEKIIK